MIKVKVKNGHFGPRIKNQKTKFHHLRSLTVKTKLTKFHYNILVFSTDILVLSVSSI